MSKTSFPLRIQNDERERANLAARESERLAALLAGSMRRRRMSLRSASSTVKVQPRSVKLSPGAGT